jgi:hypothetical protein
VLGVAAANAALAHARVGDTPLDRQSIRLTSFERDFEPEKAELSIRLNSQRSHHLAHREQSMIEYCNY